MVINIFIATFPKATVMVNNFGYFVFKLYFENNEMHNLKWPLTKCYLLTYPIVRSLYLNGVNNIII